MRYLLVICFFLVSLSSFAEGEKEYEPIVFKLMDVEKDVPFVPLCFADPATVQEYLLTVEIEYLVWLHRRSLADYGKSDGKDGNKKYLESVKGILVKKLTELRELQISCVLPSLIEGQEFTVKEK